MRHKIILMSGGTETLEYFSAQLKKAFEKLGYATFVFDQTQTEESAEELYKFAAPHDSILVTFNFEGITYETSLYSVNGKSIWEERKIPCINIAVDHPFFYPTFLEQRPYSFYEISIDKYHETYLKRFYPNIKPGPFLPLAGTSLTPDGNYMPMSQRPIDIVFTGNYTPETEFDQYITRLGDEYEKFYRDIIDDLISNPDLPDDLVMERHIRSNIEGVTLDNIREIMPNMIFIDTYIRFYFRGKAIRTLIDSGLKVHCIGNGWEKLVCDHPENLTFTPDQGSKDCLNAIAKSKISLNVMPWFKNGAHDRIFNSMLNGAVCLTDHSKYLDEILTPEENIIFYDLKHIDMLPFMVKSLLHDNAQLEYIQKNAFDFAIKNHTWEQRAIFLHNNLLKYL